MHADDERELSLAISDPVLSCGELAGKAPILAAKLARLPPEQLAMIFSPENSVGPV